MRHVLDFNPLGVGYAIGITKNDNIANLNPMEAQRVDETFQVQCSTSNRSNEAYKVVVLEIVASSLADRLRDRHQNN